SILCCTRTLVPPRSTPSPYTTLFRSRLGARYLTIDPAGFRALGTARSHRAHCERRPVRQWSNLRARLARCVAGRALRRDGRGGGGADLPRVWGTLRGNPHGIGPRRRDRRLRLQQLLTERGEPIFGRHSKENAGGGMRGPV